MCLLLCFATHVVATGMPDSLAGWESPCLQRSLQFLFIPVLGFMPGHYYCMATDRIHLISHAKYRVETVTLYFAAACTCAGNNLLDLV